ncbi:PepSY-associated TM helix domain-containing protein [Maribellus sediminis]|uniref:PepSY-associated TM helix domain-containing protein n=1 Tax=Maribellus sediminis TaxID=2696285 RepID=UPI0014303D1E|nr:PepSY-associated TM helix domain-containing protein [Maribellus sediminis]
MKKWKAFNRWLHLWLGLISGIVVFIVSITGAIFVFNKEISAVLEPWRFVEAQDNAVVPPSVLLDSAMTYVPGVHPTGLTYDGKEEAAAVGFWSEVEGNQVFTAVFLNPYTGEFIQKRSPVGNEFNFFQFINNGHRTLWLPQHIGTRVVGIATLIFSVLLISGLINWWPRTFKNGFWKNSFRIAWRAPSMRIFYDLHNVLGFYVLIFAFAIATTGLVWSFEWFGNGLYYLTSGGKQKLEHHHPHSNPAHGPIADNDSIPAIDRAFYKALAQEPDPQRIYISPYPEDEEDAIEIVFYRDKGKFYSHNEYFFDQYTVEPLRIDGDRYNEAGFGDKLEMMNYDIHTGAILGLPGKILAFFISMICASLPITGFVMWQKKRRITKMQRRSVR